jgi:hypothetical protein
MENTKGVIRRVNGRTNNKMTKGKRPMIHKILQRKLKIEQHKPL